MPAINLTVGILHSLPNPELLNIKSLSVKENKSLMLLNVF
jgi:hypothetical protein